ncbi:sensor histidine kinase [Gracilimonas sediminicola]|uniref:histidine kinase n=1 Tax=Gracilimonas sediminicola TaxID=2952158 RepID=A0A9X2RE67_9BACT|nr:HAMP domain-containing sensor histidine kinase [Gracilimonas sediminicola]MCP9291791.1 HAMP domain-containing histidine kinase [Gracilimonas sediminicola]
MIKSFRFGIILRILMLAATLLLVCYLVLETEYYVSMVILGAIIAGQVIALIKYLERTNVLLTRFLEAIRYSDFTGAFRNHGLGSNFDDLNAAFSDVIEKFKEERSKKEESIRYLETVVQHIGIGLVCFNGKGEVVLLNTAAKRLFKVATLRTLDSLKNISGSLYKTVKKQKGGNRSLIRVTIQNETLQLAMYATEFRMRDEAYKLVSFQNIHTELEEKEMEAWQNLTQVLAHEIMNSITPISSLSGTVKMLLEENMVPQEHHVELNQETIEDVTDALTTISNRSQGLMRFVNSYRDFTQIPEPSYELFKVKEALDRTASLMKTEAAKEGIQIKVEVDPESLEFTADPHLVEQVLINLVKNAIRVLSDQEDGVILMKGGIEESGKVIIQIQDNGPGVKKAMKEKIFIPFYTVGSNGKSKGSGIGLSLSRQIMRLHGGSLILNSETGKGSTFTLRF